MNYILINESHDWSDEFNTYGFTVMSKKEWNQLKEEITKLDLDGREFYFGTNEYHMWQNGKEFLKDCYEKEITFEEFKTLIRIFHSSLEHDVVDFIQKNYWITWGLTFIEQLTEEIRN